MLSALRTSVVDLHARVLDHLDAQAVSVTRELTASVDTMRHDLLSEMDSPAGGRDPRSAELLVARRMSRWSEDAARVIAVRQAQSRQHAVRLLGVIDWELVNDVAPRSDGRRYPGPIVQSYPRSTSRAAASQWLRPATLRRGTGPSLGAGAAYGHRRRGRYRRSPGRLGRRRSTRRGSRRGRSRGGHHHRQQARPGRGPAAAAETAAVDAAVRDELSRLMSVLSAELRRGHHQAAGRG